MIPDYSDIFDGLWLPSERSVRRCQAAYNRDYRRSEKFARVYLLSAEVGGVALQERRRHQAMSCGPRTGFLEMR